jgi:hypothetical protein
MRVYMYVCVCFLCSLLLCQAHKESEERKRER